MLLGIRSLDMVRPFNRFVRVSKNGRLHVDFVRSESQIPCFLSLTDSVTVYTMSGCTGSTWSISLPLSEYSSGG